MKYLIGALIAVVVMLVGAIAYSYSGIYNIAASEPHTRVGAWILDTTMRRSVQVRAAEIQVPDDLQQRGIRGIARYRETCVPCHGAPGTHGEAGGDMQPEPPALQVAVKQWKPNELFWIVKHGVKMSAMPAFGSVHSDQAIWGIVALLKRLPEMTPEQYAKLSGSGTPDVRTSIFGRDDSEGATQDPEVAQPSPAQ